MICVGDVYRKKHSGEIVFNLTKNDILLGDYRQAKLQLSQSLEIGFSRVEVQHSDLDTVLSVGMNDRSDPEFLLKKISVKGNSAEDSKLTFIFSYSLVPLFMNIGLGVFLFLLFNVSFFVILKPRIEEILVERSKAEKFKAIGEMALTMAHDLRSPLSLAAVIASKMQSANHDYADAMRSVVERIESISQDLLGKYRQSNVMRASICQTLLEANEECRARYPHAIVDISLESCKAVSNSMVVLDPSLLRRAFSNIVSNAIEACDASRQVVAISAELLNTKNVRVVIADKGRGFSRQNLRQIQRGRFATWGKFCGTGVGLKSSFDVFRKLGARVEIQSSEGKGTRFLITIPIDS